MVGREVGTVGEIKGSCATGGCILSVDIWHGERRRAKLSVLGGGLGREDVLIIYMNRRSLVIYLGPGN